MAAVVLTIQSAGVDSTAFTSQAGHADGVTFDNTYHPIIIVDNTEVANAGTLTIAAVKEDSNGYHFSSIVHTLVAATSYKFVFPGDIYQSAANIVTMTLGGAADPTKLLFSAVKQ